MVAPGPSAARCRAHRPRWRAPEGPRRAARQGWPDDPGTSDRNQLKQTGALAGTASRRSVCGGALPLGPLVPSAEGRTGAGRHDCPQAPTGNPSAVPTRGWPRRFPGTRGLLIFIDPEAQVGAGELVACLRSGPRAPLGEVVRKPSRATERRRVEVLVEVQDVTIAILGVVRRGGMVTRAPVVRRHESL
jgi:hypothetical protein